MIVKLSITLLLFGLARAEERELGESARCQHGEQMLEDGDIVARGFIPSGGCWEKRCERSVMRKRMYPCGPPASALNSQFSSHFRGRRAVSTCLLYSREWGIGWWKKFPKVFFSKNTYLKNSIFIRRDARCGSGDFLWLTAHRGSIFAPRRFT